MDDLASALAAALRPVLGPVAIEGLARMSGGASRETWSFDAVAVDQQAVDQEAGGRQAGDRQAGEHSRTGLVLRRDPPGRPSEPGAIGREARAIEAAAAAGLQVPQVLRAAETGELWGTAGLIMRRVDGETIARRILRDDAYAPARRVLTSQLGEFAAGLHALPVPADLSDHDPVGILRGQFAELQLAGLGWPSEVFELAFTELERTRPADRAPVLLHGDFRLGNLIVGRDGLHAVIDWELVHAGNPAEDLGWLCVKAWRFGVAPPVAGLGSREDLLAAYRAAGGADISLAELRWWEILGTLRWGIICMAQASAHLSGAYRSVELAAIGRRVCEQEWDLLLLLAPDAAAAAAASRPHPRDEPRPDPAPHGRPTASELLEAVRDFLTGQVVPATAGQLSFHARVAANVLAVVARELDLGALPDDVAGNVAARLAASNPKYFGEREPAPDPGS